MEKKEHDSEQTDSQLFLNTSFNSEISGDEYENIRNKNESSEEDLFNTVFMKIFSTKKTNDENEIDEKSIYLIGENVNSNSNESTRRNNSQIINNLFISKKTNRGRHRLNEQTSEKAGHKIHGKDDNDNILRKIQVNSLNYMISFANSTLKEFNYEEEFLNIDNNFKINVNKESLDSLKTQTLSDIVCNNISSKYTRKDIDTNRKIYEKIKENKVLKKIFDENYLVLFKLFFENKKRISLKDYGSDKEIFLTEKTKTFKDLINKNLNDETYIKNLYRCIYQNYLKNDSYFDVIKRPINDYKYDVPNTL